MRSFRVCAIGFFLLLASVASADAAGSNGSTPAPLITEPFSGNASTPNLWATTGHACLTAGSTSTPSSSVQACGALAPSDPAGGGALQLTQSAANLVGAAISRVPLNTALGFTVTFTDATFGTTTSAGADGMSAFFSDARLAFPTVPATSTGGKLGYLGMVGGYVAIGLDEYGNFSSSDGSGTAAPGFPGRIPETVTIRGAYSSGDQYIGGYIGTTGAPASLPFALDAPASKVRPVNAPTIRITLTPAGVLTVEIDPHDGNGYRTTYGATIVGVNGQPALPPQVYLGFAGGTGSKSQIHQILNLTITPLAAATGSFTPTQILNLAAWYDASDATTIALTTKSISAWHDKSGNSQTLTQTATAKMPTYGQNIDGLGAIDFAGGQFLSTGAAPFSSNVANASTTFVVTNATTTTTAGSVFSAGAAPGVTEPRWDLRLFESGATHFDFNNVSTGRIAATEQYAGPAFWTAAGSSIASTEYLRKDGSTIGTSASPGASVTSAYPLVVGGNFSASGALTYPFSGTIGEILVYNRLLTTAETTSVEGYLACKWGLQDRLPANHPYRTACPGAPPASPVPTPAPTTGALMDPPQLRSSNGLLSGSNRGKGGFVRQSNPYIQRRSRSTDDARFARRHRRRRPDKLSTRAPGRRG
jgi:hypothetical protein